MKKDKQTLPAIEDVLRLADVMNLAHHLPQSPEGTTALLSAAINVACTKNEAALLGPRKGGEAAGQGKKDKAAEWQSRCVEKARKMLEQGTAPRELAGKLAEQFNKSGRQVREVLKKAEVK